MGDYRITAIRPDGSDRDRRIDAVQIDFGNIYPIDTVIDWINSRVHRFWVSVNGVSVWVEVRRHPTSNREYLATLNDGYPPNNLLSLPRC